MSEQYFDGETYDEDRDLVRLSRLIDRVQALMKDGQWRTLPQICAAVEANSESSVSARLRDLRKERFGGYNIERQYLTDGLWRYRMVIEADA